MHKRLEPSPHPAELIEAARDRLPHVIAADATQRWAIEMARHVLYERPAPAPNGAPDAPVALAQAIMAHLQPGTGFVSTVHYRRALEWANQPSTPPELAVQVIICVVHGAGEDIRVMPEFHALGPFLRKLAGIPA